MGATLACQNVREWGKWSLSRRAAYQAVGGHEVVRQSPIDDIMLGRMVKVKGLHWRVVYAGDYVSCRMYLGFQAAVEGFTKNLFAVFDFRLAECLFVWLWLGLVTWEPLAVILLYILSIPSWFVLWPAVVAVAESLALWGIVLARLRFPVYLALLYPVNVAAFFTSHSVPCSLLSPATPSGGGAGCPGSGCDWCKRRMKLPC